MSDFELGSLRRGREVHLVVDRFHSPWKHPAEDVICVARLVISKARAVTKIRTDCNDTLYGKQFL